MKRAIFITVLCAFITAPAFAELYGTTRVGWKASNIGLGLTVFETNQDGVGTSERFAGFSSLAITSLAAPTLPADTFLQEGFVSAFCIDLFDGLPFVVPGLPGYDQPHLYSVKSLDSAPDPSSVPTGSGGMGLEKAAYIAELLDTNSFRTADEAAAMQIAIWEILDENYGGPVNAGSWDVSIGSGDFYLVYADNDGSDEERIAGMANALLAGLPAAAPATSFSRYTALSEASGKQLQDFVVVPVPAAVLLGMLGLSVAGVKLRKRA